MNYKFNRPSPMPTSRRSVIWNRTIVAFVALVLAIESVVLFAQTTSVVTDRIRSNTGNLTIDPVGDVMLNPTGNDVLPSNPYDINLGSLQNKFLTLHAAELWVETLVAQNTIATIGGRVLVGPTNELVQNLSTSATTLVVKYNNFQNGDRIYFEANGAVEFMAITSSASGSAGAYSYTVTRNLDGSGANAWSAGDAAFDTGQAGSGFIDLYSVRGIKAANESGPTIVGNVRNSATYNDWSPRWAIGNLNGLYGYSTDIYGAAFGVPSAAWVKIDPTNGVRLGFNSTTNVSIDTAGNALFNGSITVGTGRNMIRNSDCTVSNEDWFAGTDSGLPMTFTGPWIVSSGAWGLGGVDNDCYLTISGTPASGKIGYVFGGGTFGGVAGFPVTPGQKYEASGYIGIHRATNAYVLLQWLDATPQVIQNDFGNTCTAAFAGGSTLASYCRSGVIATAPAGAVSVRWVITTTYSGETNPYLFIVHTYLGEAGPAQTQLTPWGPGGVTRIGNGLIETNAITARTIAANTITGDRIAANTITSGNITTGTLTSTQIAANTITGGNIAANTITAADIAAGTITATEIAAGTITADRLNIGSLSAISANIGNVTAGNISGVNISGSTVTGGSGTITLNSSGLHFSGDGGNSRIDMNGVTLEHRGSDNSVYTNGKYYSEQGVSTASDMTASGSFSSTSSTPFVASGMGSAAGTTVVYDGGCSCLKKSTSSERYKEKIKPFTPTDAMAFLNANLIRFDYINGTKDVVGLSADSLAKVAPDAVNYDKDGNPESIRQESFNAYVVAALRELARRTPNTPNTPVNPNQKGLNRGRGRR